MVEYEKGDGPRKHRSNLTMQRHAVTSASWAEPPEPRAGSGDRGQVVCPRPRRSSAVAAEGFLFAFSCRHDDELNSDLGLFSRACHQESGEVKDKQSRKSDAGMECISHEFPPTRVGNPVIHDVQFIKQAEIRIPPWMSMEVSDRFGGYSSAPPM